MSLRQAVDAKCKECIYDPNSGKGTWRKQVEDCTSRSCPLFHERPVQVGNSAKTGQSPELKLKTVTE